MMITRTKSFFVSLALATLLGATSHASVIVGLILNPASTAGVSTSTRSGAGTWQLYAIEDAGSTDLGIAYYNITMTGTTAINHRSPNGTASDSNGDQFPWGFTLLRSPTSANPILASQALSPSNDITPFVITGFGREASTALAKTTALDPSANAVTALSGASWGNYSNSALSDANVLSLHSQAASMAVAAGRKWVFLAEGLGTSPLVTSAAFGVLTNSQGAQAPSTTLQTFTLGCSSACYSPTVSSTFVGNVDANVPGVVAYTFSATESPTSWGGLTFESGPTPNSQATFNSATHQFNWNTVGSPPGFYTWSVQANNQFGLGAGFITVNITVPEPATLTLFGTAVAGVIGSLRPRRVQSRDER